MNLAIWGSVATPLTTTAGSLTATVGSGTGLAPGSAINSVNVPPGTTYGAFSGTSGTLAPPMLTLPGIVATGVDAITGLPSTAGLLGAAVTGPGVPSGTTVTAITTAAVAATNISPGIPGAVKLSKAITSAPTTNGPQFFVFAPSGNVITTTGADAAATFTGQGVTFNATVQLERSFDGGYTWILCNIGGGGTLAQWAGTALTPVSLTFGEPEKNVLYRLNCPVFNAGVINFRISQTGGAAESLAIGPLSGG